MDERDLDFLPTWQEADTRNSCEVQPDEQAWQSLALSRWGDKRVNANYA